MKIIIADDHIFSLKGTEAFVKGLGHHIVATCDNGITAFNLIATHNPDIAILDINMPGMDGLAVLKKVKELLVRTRVVILSMHKEVVLYEVANENGAYGYVLKNQAESELADCLDAIANNQKYLSETIRKELDYKQLADNPSTNHFNDIENQILRLIAANNTSKQIADKLFLSEKAIEYHRAKLIHKLNLPKEKNALLKWALMNVSA